MTGDQCRWKWTYLTGKYKKAVDHNRRSGSDPKSSPYFEELCEIFDGKKDNACVETYTLDSGFPTSKPSELQSLDEENNFTEEPSEKATVQRTHSGNMRKKVRKIHGTGSAIARARVELEREFSRHLDSLSQSAEMRQETMDKQLVVLEKRLKLREEEQEIRKEELLLKKRQLKLKDEAYESFRYDRQQRHKEKIELEREKIRLLNKIVQSSEKFVS